MIFPSAIIVLSIIFILCFSSIHGLDVLSKISDTKLNVHIIPHSHDDPGWLKTVDQYYSGSNSSIYTASVQQIFRSVVSELVHYPERTFSLCEVSFFSRWWHEQNPKMKETVKYLFANGQLSFLNGGWVMHDEAASHFVSMIDQTTMGHRFLLEELGYRPRVGWQIDPFGHSNTHAWLSNEVGFDALFFGRIDYQDRDKRFKEKSMEMIWKPSMSDPSAQVFTGAFSDGNYGPPPDFCFDTTCPYCRNDFVVTDPLLQTYNLDSKIAKFIQGIQQEQSITRGNHLMLKLGSDFAYANSQSWYTSIDTLIEEVNKLDSRYNLFYSDPTSYMRARSMEKDVVWPSKKDDFFPYSDASHTFWTGYFTSRPQFKYFERYASGFLQIIRQMAAQPNKMMVTLRSKMLESIAELTAAVGLVNHHDCITGTEKQHVADDYKRVLDRAMQKAEKLFLSGPASDKVESALQFTTCRLFNETICEATQSLQAGDSVLVSVYNPLPRQQESKLITVLLSSAAVENSEVVVMPVDDAATHTLLQAQSTASLLTADKNIPLTFVPAELFPALTMADVYSQDPIYAEQAANTRLVFMARQLPTLSSQQYIVTLVPKKTVSADAWVATARATTGFAPARKAQIEEMTSFPLSQPRMLDISNDMVHLSFDRSTGDLQRMTRHYTSAQDGSSKTDLTVNVDGMFGIGYYKAFGGSQSTSAYKPLSKHDARDPHLQNIQPHPEIVKDGQSKQPSGTYIFRPSQADEQPHAACTLTNDITTLKNSVCADVRENVGLVQQMVVVRGSLMSEVHQRFSDWASHTLRLVEGDSRVEVEYQLGEIPVDDEVGKEVIYRLHTSLNTVNPVNTSTAVNSHNAHVWYTDSNGREFMQRIYNYRPTWDMEVYEPVAGNYYPLTAAQYMVDPAKNVQFSWLVDRSLGGASLSSGSMEVMVQRRLLFDDFKGVEEALNETVGGITHYPDWQRIGRGIPVTGKFHWLISPIVDANEAVGMQELRAAMDAMYFLPATTSSFYLPLTATTVKDQLTIKNQVIPAVSASANKKVPILAADLPVNVQLVTCEQVVTANRDQILLVRLAHQFAVNEDVNHYSQPVTLDIAALFASYQPTSMVELTLSANENKVDQLKNKIQWTSVDAKQKLLTVEDIQRAQSTMTITLQPMQVRTLALYLPN